MQSFPLLALLTSAAQVFSPYNELTKSLQQLQSTFGIPSVQVQLSHYYFLQTSVLQINWLGMYWISERHVLPLWTTGLVMSGAEASILQL